MKRKDREITDEKAIDEIIRTCDCCRLGIVAEDAPYVVPLNFGFEVRDGKRFLYFHGSPKGRKMELLAAHPVVGFEMDTNHQLVPALGDACQYTYRFQSIIGTGKVFTIEDPVEKALALRKILTHYDPACQGMIPSSVLSATAVFQLEVEEIACKQHI